MVEIELDARKTVEENAAIYFERSKKLKKKLEGTKKTVEEAQQKLELLKAEQIILEDKENELRKEKELKKARKREWYESFHWFISSEGFLCIGGRDATTNEIVVKKHMESNDIVFHTETPGSPFFIIKSDSSRGKKIGENTIKETAQATAVYSKAWKLGLSYTDVFWVKPEQVTKEAKSGEYIAKGAFMIYGRRNTITTDLKFFIGMTAEGMIMGAPEEAAKAGCIKSVEIAKGDEKTSDTAKKIRKLIGGDLDEIIRALPAGGCRIKNSKK